ncbi:MAG: hypothetical protein CSA75_01165 [Sorangium cellulosum]|nr:MAG: hypothetical protein CSA75_01165 [Sorangium cellulosum]
MHPADETVVSLGFIRQRHEPAIHGKLRGEKVRRFRMRLQKCLVEIYVGGVDRSTSGKTSD